MVATEKTIYGLTIIVEAAPIVSRFINQPADNLSRWMQTHGGELLWAELT